MEALKVRGWFEEEGLDEGCEGGEVIAWREWGRRGDGKGRPI